VEGTPPGNYQGEGRDDYRWTIVAILLPTCLQPWPQFGLYDTSVGRSSEPNSRFSSGPRGCGQGS